MSAAMMVAPAINYVIGDATRPVGAGLKVIAHVVNDARAWGRGFVLAVSARWKEPERDYRKWGSGALMHPFALGEVQYVTVEPTIIVANMLAQHGIMRKHDGPAIRYPWLEQCLVDVSCYARSMKASLHMPRIGCGLAGGSWDRVEPLIQRAALARGVPVTVYDLPARA